MPIFYRFPGANASSPRSHGRGRIEAPRTARLISWPVIVLHGLMAVAALKPRLAVRVFGGPRWIVLHGLMAVAALKLAQLRGHPAARRVGSPRLHGRGRIEALRGSSLGASKRGFSTVSWPWPHLSIAFRLNRLSIDGVLHGLMAVAALKPIADLSCFNVTRAVLHGLMAVAALKPCTSADAAWSDVRFSTVSLPWPH